MIKTKQELKEIYKELSKIFGDDAVYKIKSHILSLDNALNDMTKSRDNWKNKYLTVKGK